MEVHSMNIRAQQRYLDAITPEVVKAINATHEQVRPFINSKYVNECIRQNPQEYPILSEKKINHIGEMITQCCTKNLKMKLYSGGTHSGKGGGRIFVRDV